MSIELTEIFRYTAAVFGVGLLVASVILYENEEKRLQSALETLWLRSGEVREYSSSAHRRFLARLCRAALIVMPFFLGKELHSVFFLSRFFCLSAVFPFLFVAIIFLVDGTLLGTLIFAAVALLFLALSVLPSVKPRLRYLTILAASALLVLYIHFVLVEFLTPKADSPLLASIGLSTSVVTILSPMVLSRQRSYYQKAAASEKATGALLNIGLAAVELLLISIMLFVIGGILMHGALLGMVPFAVGALFVLPLSVILIGISLVIHHTIWPMLERPLYALQRAGLFKDRKRLRIVGIMLLSVVGLFSKEELKSAAEIFNAIF
jgi:hypothetical protein